MHGTRTGRLSSSQPVNLQNIPTPEKEPGTLLETLPIKNIFKSSDGRILIVMDYSGMELRIFASASRCMPMIQIHKSGKDFHSCVSIMSMTHKKPDAITFEEIDALEKAVRYRYKWTNWTLLYGGDAYTLHRMYDVDLDDAEETVRMYYEMFPEVLEYKDECTLFAETHGYIESPYGRREQLAYINDRDIGKRNADIRHAVNMPIQSAASDTLLFALIVIDDKLRNGNFKAKLVNTVHDSIVLDTPLDEVDDVVLLCKDAMENIISYGPQYFPHIDFSWLICPLKADAEIGDHYGCEEPWVSKETIE